MLEKSINTAGAVRAAGGKVFMTPILFKADASDNPNKDLGILAGCAKDSLFTENTWNGDFCDGMKPQTGDVVVKNKKGLDAFPDTTLEAELKRYGIETVAICGFLTNCCVESTMRTAFEKGFNVVTLTDCCATTSEEGQKAATTGTFTFFSTPMTAADFQAELLVVHEVAAEGSESSSPLIESSRVFASTDAKGGADIDPSKTALICIEYQNEFATEGGKLHEGVKGVMESTNMLEKSINTAGAVRAAGGKVFMTPILFKADASDNPNKDLGILAGCAKDSLFTENTWNGDFCDGMKPQTGDVVVKNKKGLDAFPDTTLEAELKRYGIETVAICGFLTNCCVESTMRTAFEKGFNVVTLTDCCATTSEEGQQAATTGTFTFFSTPMAAADFQAKMPPLPAVQPTPQSASVVMASAVMPVSVTVNSSKQPERRKSWLHKLKPF